MEVRQYPSGVLVDRAKPPGEMKKNEEIKVGLRGGSPASVRLG